ncbi:MAG: serine hydrolase [Bacteroidetes bacterium]|nr:serine hydrolase [Bacteroidota bacterium]
MSTTNRRYDIDWLRVIAIGLLLIYHIGIGFQPWGVFIGFIQSNKPLESLWIPMSMMNVWRIPLLFFVSGMGVCFAIRKRNWKQLLLERTKRIFLPFLFGIFFIVPIHILIWQKYYRQDIIYSPNPSHLWFLANIFIYVILLSPLFFYFKRNKNGKIVRWLNNLFRNPLGLLLIVVFFILEAVLVKPETYETYSMTLHGFLLGLLAFLFGFCFVISGKTFWQTILKWRWLFLSIAVILFLVRLIEFQLKAPNYLMAIESNMWIFTVFGFAYKYLNHPSKTLSYLSQGAYPIYIIHMIFLYLGSFLIFPLGIPTVLKFVLTVAFTGIGCFALYDLVIKRVSFLRPLFGLKKVSGNVHTAHKIKQMKKNKSFIMKKAIIIITILSIFNVSCTLESFSQYTYQPPENINDGFKVGTLAEVNIDAKLIEKAVNEILQSKNNEVHSMIIFKDGKLVLEKYFEGHKWNWDGTNHHGDLVIWDRTMLHNIHSATKSITSACIGIAIDHGFIENVHQSIFDYLPEHQHLKIKGKNKITIEHLLTMTSGLEWREWSAPYSSSENPAVGVWFQNKDPITYILEKQLLVEPGTSFNYATGNMIVLGEIIKNATKMNIDEFSQKYLFKHLGIDSLNWPLKFKNGVDGNNLEIRPKEMAKIGATFLDKGVWNGKRIVSEQWVEKSADDFPGNHRINIPGEASGRMGYSYPWWTKTYSQSGMKIHMFTALRFGGQHIMVLPEVNTVVVFTGGNYLTKRPPFKILEKYIIPAII